MSLEKIKNLREKTGAGMVDIKKALEESGGNEEKAIEILRKRGLEKASKKSSREADEGIIASYVHSNNKVGALLKICCETDFVAMNKEFQDLARDIAMHITAMNPMVVSPQDIEEKIIEKEKEIWIAQLEQERKPAEIMEKILAGKEKKFREESALLTQPFVKNPEITIGELISEKTAIIGEKIQVKQFFRIEL